MAKPRDIIRRPGSRNYYFNKAYPRDVQAKIGRAPFRLSLGTESLAEALERRPAAEQKYWERVRAARGRIAEERPRPLTEAEHDMLIARFVARADRLTVPFPKPPRPVEPSEDGQRPALPNPIHELRSKLVARDYSPVQRIATKLLTEAGIQPDREHFSYFALLRDLMRAFIGVIEKATARENGYYDYEPGDPLYRRALERGATTDGRPVRTLNDLISAYEADKGPGWSESTREAYKPVFRLLKDVIGPNRDLATITREDGRRLFETVKALPRGLGTIPALKGLTVPEAVAKGRELGLRTLAPKSINDSYMALMRSMFRWAVAEQWMAANPLDGLSVKDTVADAEKRDPFTLDQLKAIFGSDPWKPRDDSPSGKPIRFWGPLLALFHGMRRGEIAGLNVEDIVTSEGVPLILVRANEGRRLKTANARRRLPVHPELQRMGFMEFVRRQQEAGHTQLFPGEVPNARGQVGDGFSDWFTRLVAKKQLSGRKLGMHSLRHNWQDRLREAGLHGTAIGQELAGRSKGGDVSNNYGSGFSTQALADAVAKISYPGLDLFHLWIEEAPELVAAE